MSSLADCRQTVLTLQARRGKEGDPHPSRLAVSRFGGWSRDQSSLYEKGAACKSEGMAL